MEAFHLALGTVGLGGHGQHMVNIAGSGHHLNSPEALSEYGCYVSLLRQPVLFHL